MPISVAFVKEPKKRLFTPFEIVLKLSWFQLI